jgi:hypothetical protein
MRVNRVAINRPTVIVVRPILPGGQQPPIEGFPQAIASVARHRSREPFGRKLQHQGAPEVNPTSYFPATAL